MKDIRGANAILTGASRGIGTYIARTLASRGVNLALAARSADKLEETRRACETFGVKVVCVPTDVSDRFDLQRLYDTAVRELGPVDIVINNAGIEQIGTLASYTFDEIDAIIRTNLNAPIWLSKIAVTDMVARRRGAIVHISSMAGKGPAPFNAIYSATKHGLQGFTASMNLELDGTGVTMSTVNPGFVASAGMWADRGGKAPRWMREVSPQKVADAVLKAIEGHPEVLVTPGPIRPLLALNELFPRMGKSVVKRMGIVQAMRTDAAGYGAGEPREERESAGTREGR